MSNNLPENVFPISYPPTQESGNQKGEILWYANGHGWYMSQWNLGYMPWTSHWTYMPEDLNIPSDAEVLNQTAFERWIKDNIPGDITEKERELAWQAWNSFNFGRKRGPA